MKAVILAGGKGTRLRPYTTNFPKPLLPVGDKPVLEIIINQLRSAGITEIIISTGYLGEMVKVFFMDGSKLGVKITYSEENEPLGTAGPLNLLREQLTGTFLVMNGDVLSDLDFSDFIEFHRMHKASATVALSRRNFSVELGVVEIDASHCFMKWEEKPRVEYLVSTGIYLFECEVLEILPSKGFFNIPDLINSLHNQNRRVLGYVHKGYWLDIGKPADYEKACLDMENKKTQC